MEHKEKLLQVMVDTEGYGGRPKYTIYYIDKKGEPVQVLLPIGLWNKSIIINELVRSVYSQDHVEAIINNHFLAIAEWLDKRFKGEEVKFEDPEYEGLQEWRKICKDLATEALEQYPAI